MEIHPDNDTTSFFRSSHIHHIDEAAQNIAHGFLEQAQEHFDRARAAMLRSLLAQFPADAWNSGDFLRVEAQIAELEGLDHAPTVFGDDP